MRRDTDAGAAFAPIHAPYTYTPSAISPTPHAGPSQLYTCLAACCPVANLDCSSALLLQHINSVVGTVMPGGVSGTTAKPYLDQKALGKRQEAGARGALRKGGETGLFLSVAVRLFAIYGTALFLASRLQRPHFAPFPPPARMIALPGTVLWLMAARLL
jgi:hypothetical protein